MRRRGGGYGNGTVAEASEGDVGEDGEVGGVEEVVGEEGGDEDGGGVDDGVVMGDVDEADERLAEEGAVGVGRDGGDDGFGAAVLKLKSLRAV